MAWGVARARGGDDKARGRPWEAAAVPTQRATRSTHVFRLAHISDLHLAPLPPVGWSELANQRLLGYLSWRWRRRRKHRRPILDALVRDLHGIGPDHVAITGDLVNLGLPAEFELAAAWLRGLGPPEWISLVPGNHDAYVPLPLADGWDHWRDYTTSDPDATDLGAAAAGGFPFVRRRGPLALVGLSTASPSPPTFATGRLGDAQLKTLDHLLGRLATAGRYRVLLIHHPPQDGVSPARKRLLDAIALRDIVARRGAELILHGHEHELVVGQVAGAGRPVPVIGVPSASKQDPRPGHGAQYHVYGIEPAGDGWRCHLEIRRFSAEAGGFSLASRQLLGEEPDAARFEPVAAARC